MIDKIPPDYFYYAGTLFAAFATAAYAGRQYQLNARLSRRDLRLQVRDLNTALNERTSTVRKIHSTHKINLDASFGLTGRTNSDQHKLFVEEWAKDGQNLDAAITKIESVKRTFGDLDNDQLEEKLISLKSVERVFDYEHLMGKDWEADRDRSYQYSQDNKPLYR